MLPQSPSDGWSFVAATGRYYYWKANGKRLVVGDDGGEPPRYFFVAFRNSKTIAHDEGYASAEAAQLAAEAV